MLEFWNTKLSYMEIFGVEARHACLRGRDVIVEGNLAGASNSRDDKIGKIFAEVDFLEILLLDFYPHLKHDRTNVRQTFLEDDARQDYGRRLWYVSFSLI